MSTTEPAPSSKTKSSNDQDGVQPLTKEMKSAWKRTTKLLKLKDTGKKIEGIQYCATDGRFFREGGCLSVLMAFLTRIKQHEVLHQALLMFVSLIASNDKNLKCYDNAIFLLEEGSKATSPWTSGEYFLNTLTMAIDDDSKIAAVKVYTELIEHSTALPNDYISRDEFLTNLFTLGNPIPQLAGVLHSSNIELQFLALTALFTLLKGANDEAYIDILQTSTDVIQTLVGFLNHTDNCFHDLTLQLVEWLATFEKGRSLLNAEQFVIHLTKKLESCANTVKSAEEIDNPEIATASRCLDMTVLVLVRLHITSQFTLSDDSILIEAVNYMVCAVASAPLRAKCNMSTSLNILAALGRLIERNSLCHTQAKKLGIMTTLLHYLVIDDRESIPPEQADSSVQEVDSKGKKNSKANATKEKQAKEAPPPAVEDMDPTVLEMQAKLRAEKATKMQQVIQNIRNVADKLLHLCIKTQESNIVDDPIFGESSDRGTLMNYELFLNIITSTDTMTLLRGVRLVAKIVEQKSNGSKFGPQGTPYLLNILQDQFKLQSQSPSGESDAVKHSDSLSYASFITYISQCLVYLSVQSTETCDACGDESKSPVPALIAYFLEHRQDSPILLDNPLGFTWGVDDKCIETLNVAPLEYKPQVWAAKAVAALSQCLGVWLATLTPRPEEPPPVEKKGAKDKKAPVKEISMTGDKVTQRIAAYAWQLLQLLHDTQDFKLHIEILAILKPIPLLPNGRKSLLKQTQEFIVSVERNLIGTEANQALDAMKVSTPEGIQLGHWPFPETPAFMVPHQRIIAEVLQVCKRINTPVADIASALNLLQSLVVDEKASTDEYDIDLFANAALHEGALPMLIALNDIQRIESHQVNESISQLLQDLTQYLINLGRVRESSVQIKLKAFLDDEEDGSAAQADAISRSKTIAARYAQLLSVPHDFQRLQYTLTAALYMAIDLSQVATLSSLLAAGVSPLSADFTGKSCLMHAFSTGHEEIIQLLLDVGASVDAITGDGASVLKYALLSTDLVQTTSIQNLIRIWHDGSGRTMETAIALDTIPVENIPKFFLQCLERGSDPNISGDMGSFPLLWVLSECYLRARIRGCHVCFRYNSEHHSPDNIVHWTKLLIEYKANVNTCNKLGQTPLHVALIHGHGGAAQILLQHGANPFIADKFGCFSLHYLCMGRCSKDDSLVLLETILNLAHKYEVTKGVFEDLRKGKSAGEKRIVELEAIFNQGLSKIIAPPSIVICPSPKEDVLLQPSQSGLYPFHFSCGGHESNISISQQSMHASQDTRIALLDEITNGYKINLATETMLHANALHFAAKADQEGSNAGVINYLIHLGIPLNLVHESALIDNGGVVAYGAVVNHFSLGIAQVSSYNHVFDTYHLLFSGGEHTDGVPRSEFIDDQTFLALKAEFAFSPLHYAIQHSDNATWQLVHAGAELKPEGADVPLLTLACAAGRSLDVFEYLTPLLSTQISIRVHLNELWSGTALHFAVQRGSLDVLCVLLATSNASSHLKVKRATDGYTPLHVACSLDNQSIVLLLLAKGASIWESDGKTNHAPIHCLFDVYAVKTIQICFEKHYLIEDDIPSLEAYANEHLLVDGNQHFYNEICELFQKFKISQSNKMDTNGVMDFQQVSNSGMIEEGDVK
ncbi:hypothetical protein THRCLA_03495 [Thraustotheca clavata]|uniref:Uncharacterized protein n=1 Tax=Thraustotheca clavata TaxID=74557 RepID=A0A1W0A1X1_9STRA|nr:hypothetical protein THRCLA_03495 [Thraustotheca clavata]